jgi:hypothetical protein
MPGDALDIGRRKKRSRRFAAIGTLQTIGALEFSVMQILHYIIDILGRLLFELIEILFVFVMLIFGKLGQVVEQLFHAAKLGKNNFIR